LDPSLDLQGPETPTGVEGPWRSREGSRPPEVASSASGRGPGGVGEGLWGGGWGGGGVFFVLRLAEQA